MRILVQRCRSGSVTVDQAITGQIEQGFVLLVGIGQGDDSYVVKKMAEKVVHLRVFNNEDGKFSKSLLDIDGHALVVSQFTLFADAKKGRRPSFSQAAPPAQAEQLVSEFAHAVKALGIAKVETGIFGANMQVELCNDGPVTIWLDSNDLFSKTPV